MQRVSARVLPLVGLTASLLAPDGAAASDIKRAAGCIGETDLRATIDYIASPLMEGRDSPSVGQELTAKEICAAFKASGLVAAADWEQTWSSVRSEDPPEWGAAPGGGTYLRPFMGPATQGRRGRSAVVPDKDLSELEWHDGKDASESLELGRDFVPLPGFSGTVKGELAWAGFGIRANKERYDDFRGVDLKGKVAVIVEGEPNHRR